MKIKAECYCGWSRWRYNPYLPKASYWCAFNSYRHSTPLVDHCYCPFCGWCLCDSGWAYFHGRAKTECGIAGQYHSRFASEAEEEEYQQQLSAIVHKEETDELD